MNLLEKINAEGRQMSLDQAARSRDAGFARVENAADPEWKAAALEAVRRTAVELPDFISDDVWTVGGLVSTVEDRALGPIFQRAARNGWIRKSDRVRPSVRSNLSGKTVWIFQLHEGAAAA